MADPTRCGSCDRMVVPKDYGYPHYGQRPPEAGAETCPYCGRTRHASRWKTAGVRLSHAAFGVVLGVLYVAAAIIVLVGIGSVAGWVP